MPTLIYLTIITILFVLYVAELLARRQADFSRDQLRQHLEDAISTELDQYEENQRLLASLHQALADRNAANLRAARAINSLRALPPVQIHSPLPDQAIRPVPFNVN